MQIKIDNYRGCCGIQILYDFGNTKVTAGSIEDLSIKQINIELKKYLITGYFPSYYPPDQSGPTFLKKKAITLIALNSEQNKKLRTTLLKIGFTKVAKGWNQPHKNYNYLYARTLNKKDYKLSS